MNQRKALARRALGFQSSMSEAKRSEFVDMANAIVDSIDDNEPAPKGFESVRAVLAGATIANRMARLGLEEESKRIAKDMVSEIKSLPAHAWQQSIDGFGDMSFARIVGECGDLSQYSNPGKLWKRMGLAPDSAYEMVTKAGKAAIAKPKRRRAVMWNIGQCLVKNSKGPYRQVYLYRKQYEAEKAKAEGKEVVSATDLPKGYDKTKFMTLKHIDNRAQRYMEKRLLRDLWIQWRKDCGHPSADTQEMSAAVL